MSNASNDIFSTDTTVSGTYVATKAVLTLSGDDKLNGMLITDMNVNYNRPMQKIIALNSSGSNVEIYQVYGIPQGSASISNLIGPKASAAASLSKLGDPCSTDNDVELKFAGSTCAAGSATASAGTASRTLYGVALGGTSFQVGSQDMMCRDNLSLTFSTLSDGN